MNDEMRDRHEELLVTRALFGLSEEEQRQLSMLQLKLGVPDDSALELAAAAVELACAGDGSTDAVPSRVLEEIGRRARAHFAAPTKAAGGLGVAPRRAPQSGTLVIPPSVDDDAKRTEVLPSRVMSPSSAISSGAPSAQVLRPAWPAPTAPTAPPIKGRAVQLAGWLMAAACFALAVAGWWPSRTPESIETARAGLEMPTLASSASSPAAARASLLARAKDLLRIDWTHTDDPAARGATGDVVWSPIAQQGYMRIRGLKPNDRTESQYQLWIFDKNQDERFPVDGGVFDVDPSGEVIVPISAKLNVVEPTLFAITIEKPGGVVVSKRERIVMTAANG